MPKDSSIPPSNLALTDAILAIVKPLTIIRCVRAQPVVLHVSWHFESCRVISMPARTQCIPKSGLGKLRDASGK